MLRNGTSLMAGLNLHEAKLNMNMPGWHCIQFARDFALAKARVVSFFLAFSVRKVVDTVMGGKDAGHFALAKALIVPALVRRTTQKSRLRFYNLNRLLKKGWRRPTLPHSCPCSTIGDEELNFRVRDGNGWTLFSIAAKVLAILITYN